MPYISVHTNVTLSADKKDLIKSELGRLLPIIPGKTEAGLMVEFLDGVTMYKAGTSEPCAMVDMRCFKEADVADNQKFVEEALAMLEKELCVDSTRLYLSIAEFATWGARGILNT